MTLESPTVEPIDTPLGPGSLWPTCVGVSLSWSLPVPQALIPASYCLACSFVHFISMVVRTASRAGVQSLGSIVMALVLNEMELGGHGSEQSSDVLQPHQKITLVSVWRIDRQVRIGSQ